MVYILAGADGSGKSTCFEKLKKNLAGRFVFVKESYTSDEDEKYLRLVRLRNFIFTDVDVIYDRATVLDDVIYEPIKQGRESSLLACEVASLLKKCTIIYFTCSDSVLEKRLSDRGDEYVTVDDIPAIKRAYNSFFNKHEIMPYLVNCAKRQQLVYGSVYSIVCKKKFKVAHIVPVAHLEETASQQYHMCLAHLVKECPEYEEFYTKMAASGDKFVLMDNGAAEGSQLSIDELLPLYDKVKPSEVVLPDTICNCNDTIEKGQKALAKIAGHYVGGIPYSIMAVPQGKTLEEWARCADFFVSTPTITSIGVSKFLQMELGFEEVRYEALLLLEDIIKRYDRIDVEVHLLGCSETSFAISEIRKRFPFVRGCDSAYAYIYTQANKSIFAHTERPDGEIDFINGEYYPTLINNMTAWEIETGALNNLVDGTWR